MKPHKGTITHWWKQPCSPEYGLGFVIRGTFVDHPEFMGERGRTSWVVSIDEENKTVETRNSIYTLGTEWVRTNATF